MANPREYTGVPTRSSRVLQFIAANPGCSVDQIKDGISEDRKLVRNSLKVLARYKRVIATRTGIENRYEYRVPAAETVG